MSTTRLLALAAAGLLALTAGHGLAQKPKEQPKTDTPQLPNEAQVMQVKLQRAQAVLGALAKEDFKTLGESADSLVKISKATRPCHALRYPVLSDLHSALWSAQMDNCCISVMSVFLLRMWCSTHAEIT